MSTNDSEHRIQSQLVSMLPRLMRPDIVRLSIPNGGLRHPLVAMKLKAEGLEPGSPDMIFAMHEGRSAWLEMKAAKGRLSDVQQGMRARLLRLGHTWGVASSVDEALDYLAVCGVLK